MTREIVFPTPGAAPTWAENLAGILASGKKALLYRRSVEDDLAVLADEAAAEAERLGEQLRRRSWQLLCDSARRVLQPHAALFDLPAEPAADWPTDGPLAHVVMARPAANGTVLARFERPAKGRPLRTWSWDGLFMVPTWRMAEARPEYVPNSQWLHTPDFALAVAAAVEADAHHAFLSGAIDGA